MFNVAGVPVDVNNQAAVMAMEPATVWVVNRTALLEIMRSRADLALAFARDLAHRLIHLMGLVEDLSLRPVVARLARILLEQSTGEIMHRRQWSTQAEMAAQLGTVPDVVHRALRNLSHEGLIQVERRRIRILDRSGLESKAMLNE